MSNWKLESDSWDFSQSNRLSLTRIQNKQLEYLKISFVRKEREAASIGKFKGVVGHRLADAGIVRLGRLWNQKQQRAFFASHCIAAPFIPVLFRRLDLKFVIRSRPIDTIHAIWRK